MRATAGTEVVIDVLVFQRRAEGQTPSGRAWTNLARSPSMTARLTPATKARATHPCPTPSPMPRIRRRRAPAPRRGVVADQRVFCLSIPRWCSARTPSGAASTAPDCPTPAGRGPVPPPIESLLRRGAGPAALRHRHRRLTKPRLPDNDDDPAVSAGTAADGATIKEGSFFVGKGGRLMPDRERPAGRRSPSGTARAGRGSPLGRQDHPRLAADPRRHPRRAARPGRRPPLGARRRSGSASPIPASSATTARSTTPSSPRSPTPRPAKSGKSIAGPTSRISRMIRIAGWSPASRITTSRAGLARKGPIFRERVIAPPATPLITSAADALAVTLNEIGRVDLDHLADLLERDPDAALAATRHGRVPQSATPRRGKPPTPISPARCGPSSRLPKLPPRLTRNTSGTSWRCVRSSRRTSAV